MTLTETLTNIIRDGFILVFNQDKLDVVKTAQALLDAGINNMEVTCRISKPLENIARLRQELPEFVIGATSLLDSPVLLDRYNQLHPDDPLPSLQEVIDVGVDYLVSAVNFQEESFKAFSKSHVMIPGCGTVSEIIKQYEQGAHICKLFPASQLGGPSFVKAIDPAIHKLISLVPTGGTNTKNIPDYINAGILVLGGSFSMIEKATMQKIISDQDYNLLSAEIEKVKVQINVLRKEKWPTIDWGNFSLDEITQSTGRCFNL